MADITVQRAIPRGALIGVGMLLAATIALAGITHATNAQHVVLAPTHAVATIDLAFQDLPGGGIAVTDAGSGRTVETIAPETGHFLRGIIRALVFGHRRAGEQGETAFRLTRWADGRLSIADPVTQESFDLEAFGSTNVAVFARFLEAPAKKVAEKASASTASASTASASTASASTASASKALANTAAARTASANTASADKL